MASTPSSARPERLPPHDLDGILLDLYGMRPDRARTNHGLRIRCGTPRTSAIGSRRHPRPIGSSTSSRPSTRQPDPRRSLAVNVCSIDRSRAPPRLVTVRRIRIWCLTRRSRYGVPRLSLTGDRASRDTVLPRIMCPMDMNPRGCPGEISILPHMWFSWSLNSVVRPAFVRPGLVRIRAATTKSTCRPKDAEDGSP